MPTDRNGCRLIVWAISSLKSSAAWRPLVTARRTLPISFPTAFENAVVVCMTLRPERATCSPAEELAIMLRVAESESKAFVDTSPGEVLVRGFLHRAPNPSGDTLVLTHVASGNCNSPLLVALAEAFAASGLNVLRCDLPFRQLQPHGPHISHPRQTRPRGVTPSSDGIERTVLWSSISGRAVLWWASGEHMGNFRTVTRQRFAPSLVPAPPARTTSTTANGGLSQPACPRPVGQWYKGRLWLNRGIGSRH